MGGVLQQALPKLGLELHKADLLQEQRRLPPTLLHALVVHPLLGLALGFPVRVPISSCKGRNNLQWRGIVFERLELRKGCLMEHKGSTLVGCSATIVRSTEHCNAPLSVVILHTPLLAWQLVRPDEQSNRIIGKKEIPRDIRTKLHTRTSRGWICTPGLTWIRPHQIHPDLLELSVPIGWNSVCEVRNFIDLVQLYPNLGRETTVDNTNFLGDHDHEVQHLHHLNEGLVDHRSVLVMHLIVEAASLVGG
mmetsp:Transcript_60361/g.143844  ORF Transcript_60361/g.143844 Transcript_60361/m.143844 type:complete len:249 (+) Transcript_60361:1375-2121(+)